MLRCINNLKPESLSVNLSEKGPLIDQIKPEQVSSLPFAADGGRGGAEVAFGQKTFPLRDFRRRHQRCWRERIQILN